MVLGLCPVHQQYPGHREVVRNANSTPLPTPPPTIESESMYVGPSYLCIQKFSRRCFCKLYFGKL